MRAAGFTLAARSDQWSSMGPIAALALIPRVLWASCGIINRLLRDQPDLLVLIDFGAFNLRLVGILRRLGYRRPILYFFPPGAWLDNPKVACAVARLALPLTAFAHQRDFYRGLALPISFFGHPLVAEYRLRPARPAPPRDGGVIALLPGSRQGEVRFHLPVLLDAFTLLKRRRPNLRAVLGAANAQMQQSARAQIAARNLTEIEVVLSAENAYLQADAAWIASGTAVLEAALTGVPSIALYILSKAQAKIARRVYRGPAITIPNLVLGRTIVPELLQEAATPQNLADRMEELLTDPQRQYGELLDLRAALGPSDALAQAAAYAYELARA